MFSELGPMSLMILTTVAIIALAALLIASRWLNPMFLIAGAFFLLSPISSAIDFPFVHTAKLGRVCVTFLLILTGFFVLRLYRLGRTGLVFVVFVGWYVLAGLWSDAPLGAFLFKGNYGATVLAGLLLAYSVRNFGDLQVGLRTLVAASAIFAGFVLLELVRNPGAISRVGRLAAFGMNPNTIGMAAAPMLILCTYIAFYDSLKSWKVAGYVIGAALGLLILYTGSRGAAGQAVLGCFIVSIRLVRRPGVLVFVAMLVSVTVYIAFTSIETEAAERLLDPSLGTRESPWSIGLDYFRDAPLFGQGWVYFTSTRKYGSTTNLLSIYLQTLAETGVSGAVLMAFTLAYAALRGLRMHRVVRTSGFETQNAYLAIGIAGAVLAHGVIESASMMGSSINGFLLPFALGLFDRLPEMIREAGTWPYETRTGEVDTLGAPIIGEGDEWICKG